MTRPRYVLNYPIARLFCLGVVALFAVSSASAQDDGDPNPLQLGITHSGPAEYFPGQPVEIVVTFTTINDGSITALGLLDTGPQNWTYLSMRPISGDVPAVAPQPGSSAAQLNFAWITIPESFPYSFAFTLNVPAEATGLATIQGQAEYRTDGERQVSPPDFITIEGPDNAAPKIQLVGDATIQVTQGNVFQDPGTIATDPEDGDLTKKVQVDGSVDTQTPGNYVLTYSVSDSQGKEAPTVTRTVTVVAKDETKPPTKPNTGNNNGNGNNNFRNRGTLGAGMDGNTEGPRVRDEELANTGDNAGAAAPGAPLPGETLAEQKARSSALAQQLAAQGDPNARSEDAVVPTGIPPRPGPIASNIGRKSNLPAVGKPAAVPAAQDDLAALDSALEDPGAPGPRSGATANTPEGATAAPDGGVPPMASVANQAALATAPVPGLIERVQLRVKGLGPRELATIAGFGVVLLGLLGFAAVAGRIAYGGQSRRAPVAPKSA